jgi:ornithine decarboxylase
VQGEIKSVLKMNVDPSRIIYANPCKQTSFIQYAQKKKVDMMTFDNEFELIKIKRVFPTAK